MTGAPLPLRTVLLRKGDKFKHLKIREMPDGGIPEKLEVVHRDGAFNHVEHFRYFSDALHDDDPLPIYEWEAESYERI